MRDQFLMVFTVPGPDAGARFDKLLTSSGYFIENQTIKKRTMLIAGLICDYYPQTIPV